MKKYLYLIPLLISFVVRADSIAIVFDTPGVYKYAWGMNGNPTDPNDSLFIITSSNVTLDLGNGTFGQQPGNSVPGFRGVVVNDNLANVKIINGKFANFTGEGVYVNDGCAEFVAEALTLESCTNAGIFCEGSITGTGLNNLTIRNCNFSNIGSSGGSAYGLRIKKCSRLVMSDCLFEGTSQLINNEGRGISFEQVSAFQITNCKSLGQNGLEAGIGYSFEACHDGIVTTCIAYYNYTAGGSANALSYGFSFTGCTRLFVSDCQGVSNFALVGKGAGFYSTAGSQNIFEKSLAQNNSGQAGVVGFGLDDEVRSYLDLCMSRGNTSQGGNAYGIRLINTCDNCYVEDNTVVNNSGVQSFGITDDSNPSSTLVIGNYALNNINNYSITYPAGITLPLIEGSLSNNVIGLPGGQSGVFDNVSVTP